MKASKYTKETIASLGIRPTSFPEFNVGDCIEVVSKIKEGEKERLQAFEGDVIGIHNHGASSTFTVRRIGANNVAIERVYPFSTPTIHAIRFIRRGDVRRAKLYYMRGRIGKAARVAEKVLTHEEKELRKKTHAAA